ncbi:MAG: hypothetical protein IPF51_12165 [Dehalococcoidia bacterium]|uniref:hypothetical protein n=1 Tax=Candidatus Amarobacter glycogenicus TaxID=3140699 RepID=UPI003135CDD0|nr:hypothetical protein [Dehalococcoidia bacterium]
MSPRPAVRSARRREAGDRVGRELLVDATGSFVPGTVTALVSLICFGALAAAARRTAGVEGGKVRPVVLANAEDIEPDAVVQFDLLHRGSRMRSSLETARRSCRLPSYRRKKRQRSRRCGCHLG